MGMMVEAHYQNAAKDVRNGFLHAEEGHCDTGGWIVVGRNDNSKTIKMYCKVVGLAFLQRLRGVGELHKGEKVVGYQPTATPYVCPRNSAEEIHAVQLGRSRNGHCSSACSMENSTPDCGLWRLRDAPNGKKEAKMRDVSDRAHV